MFSTLRSLPFRPADWSLASPFLNPITYASFEMVAPETGPFFLGWFESSLSPKTRFSAGARLGVTDSSGMAESHALTRTARERIADPLQV